MPNSFNREEFERLMGPWVYPERDIALDRLATSYQKLSLERFTEEQGAIMRTALEVLIPQKEEIDLVGFIDDYVDKPLGRGDRKPGMPAKVEIIRKGLDGLQQMAQDRHNVAFVELDAAQVEEILREVQEGRASGSVWESIPAKEFFNKFYSLALHGYFSHPRAWMRIGFMGAAYPEGYRWLGRAQVQQRHNREIGWEVM